MVSLGDEARDWTIANLPKLREAGVSATMDYKGRSMKAQMKEANRQNARFALIIGEDELKEGKFTFRNMNASEEQQLSFDQIIAHFK